MTKPTTRDGYSPRHALDCERVLVTLLRGLGPWKDAVYLVGGLTPRYLVNPDPPRVPEHSGTQDVDIVIDLPLLTDTAAYNTLEHNLKRIGFVRAENSDGAKVSWRWQIQTQNGTLVLVELLTEAPDIAGGRHQPLPTDGALSAINIPHASIVHDMYRCAEITAELLGDDGLPPNASGTLTAWPSLASRPSPSTIAKNAKMPMTSSTASNMHRAGLTMSPQTSVAH